MKLFLTSRTIMPNLVYDFEKFSGLGISGLKVAFIIDALYAPGFNSPKQIEEYTKEDTEEVIDLYGWELDVIRIETEANMSMGRFEKYDIIYFNGGFSGHLAKVLRSSGFDEIVYKLLPHKIFVGSSGGSMVFSGVQDVATWYPGEAEPEAADIPGLGLIDFQIFPHYRESLLPEIEARCKSELTYYLIPDEAAISVSEAGIKLHGPGIEIIEAEK